MLVVIIARLGSTCAASDPISYVLHFALDHSFFFHYSCCATQKELIREVEMGPFKHTVDDGLDLRKAAFECMYTLLETCLDRLDSFEFLNHVEDGLKDHYDIKVRP